MQKLRIPGLVVALLAGVLLASAAQATPIVRNVALDKTKFGNLDQATTACPNFSCGPTAAVNSFVWLQKQYPTIYDNKLIMGSLKNTANMLLAAAYMNTSCSCGGTFWDDFIFGKRKWIEEKVPGKTVYAAQSKFTWGGGHTLQNDRKTKPAFVDKKSPTWQFIFDNLKSGEDIEILMNGGPNHYVTLVSLKWTDTDMDNVIDGSEAAKLGFIDPAGGVFKEVPIRQSGLNQPLFLDYFGNTNFTAEITVAVKESPIPEPFTLAVFGFGLAGLAFMRRRRAA